MSEKTLTDAGRKRVRQLIEAAHVVDVIEVCEAYCREQKAHCDETPGFSAIGAEWSRAAGYLAKAAEEIEP